MKKKFDIAYVVVLLLAGSLVYSCANKGAGPQGGPKDETPPQVMKSVPENGVVNFQKKEIQVDFDENISLEKASDNVIVSPPQKRNPDIRAQGKRLVIRFDDDLRDSTTYSINFGNALVDLNEKNPLRDYRFAFSTGPTIDTLGVSGYVVEAENLNPVKGVFVGIHESGQDSAFLQQPFLRVGKTNDEGHFSVDNMKPGAYQLYALGDNNRDYFFQPGEGLALCDSLIVPSAIIETHSDTVYTDTTKMVLDTILIHDHTRLLPDDIVLRFFKEAKKRQNLIKSERQQKEKVTLVFNTTLAELPEIEPLNFDWENNYILERNNTLDTLNYWVLDSLVWQQDTLQMAVTYLKTDSVFNLYPATDTLNVTMRRMGRQRNRKDEVPKVEPLSFSTNIASAMEVYDPIILKVGEPLQDYDIDKITLSQKVDTVFVPIDYDWRQVDSTKMNFAIDYDRIPGNEYRLEVDSAAFISVYGKASNKSSGVFKVRTLEEYSEIKVVLTNYDPRAVVQILDTRDKVVTSQKAETNEILFRNLKPIDYYIRLFIDENGNGVWDTGDLATRRQPEEVYYYPHKLTLKANFEFTETWDHKAIPLLEQKPKELIEASNKKK